MKWLVRIAAGVLIAVLVITMLQPGVYAKTSFLAIVGIIYLVARYEGIDVTNFWGDDDDDQQGPFRPA